MYVPHAYVIVFAEGNRIPWPEGKYWNFSNILITTTTEKLRTPNSSKLYTAKRIGFWKENRAYSNDGVQWYTPNCQS